MCRKTSDSKILGKTSHNGAAERSICSSHVSNVSFMKLPTTDNMVVLGHAEYSKTLILRENLTNSTSLKWWFVLLWIAYVCADFMGLVNANSSFPWNFGAVFRMEGIPALSMSVIIFENYPLEVAPCVLNQHKYQTVRIHLETPISCLQARDRSACHRVCTTSTTTKL